MYFVRPPYPLQKLYSGAIWRVPTSEKIIYLTFDDGPLPEVTPFVLETLKKFNAKATFFCVGENVTKQPEVFKKIREEGHAIGNHTYHHLNGWKTKDAIYLEDIKKCAEVFDSKLFRPPYGKIKKSQILNLKSQIPNSTSQYSHLNTHISLIMWDVLSGDYDKNTSPQKCLKNVINYTREGSIVVFHDSVKAWENLSYALPRALEYFSEKGYRFCTLG